MPNQPMTERRQQLEQLAAWQKTPVGRAYTVSFWIAAPLAAALSYQRSGGIGMALVHGLLIPRFYLVYRGVQAVGRKE